MTTARDLTTDATGRVVADFRVVYPVLYTRVPSQAHAILTRRLDSASVEALERVQWMCTIWRETVFQTEIHLAIV